LADLEREAHFGEFIRHPERPAGVALDAVQTVPDSVSVDMQLCGGIGDRALIGNPALKVSKRTSFSSVGRSSRLWRCTNHEETAGWAV